MGSVLKSRLDELAGMNNNLFIGGPEDIVAELQPNLTIKL